MRVKVYRGWIDHCEYLVDAPNRYVAKWCIANLHNNRYLDFATAKDVKRLTRFKTQEEN